MPSPLTVSEATRALSKLAYLTLCRSIQALALLARGDAAKDLEILVLRHQLTVLRGIESSQRLGRHRYVVERSLAWLVGCRRLQVRYERRADLLLGFVYLACALIWLNSLNRPKGGRQAVACVKG